MLEGGGVKGIALVGEEGARRMIELQVVADSDDVVLSWRTAAGDSNEKIAECLGFAVQRRLDRKTAEYLDTYMPFAREHAERGEHRPSWQWPIQRFLWTDHLAPTTGQLSYRVAPVFGQKAPGADPTTAEPADSDWSDWSEPVSCATRQTPSLSLFPNRGIVASPWITNKLDDLMATPANRDRKVGEVLTEAIGEAGNELREDLAGNVLTALREQFTRAADENLDLFVCLYELRDAELIGLLKGVGSRVHVILSNGAFKPDDLDPNADAAQELAAAGVDCRRRMVSSGHFAHNKFVVFVDGDHPIRVWTGSTNWTPSGLCTQANHALLIEDTDIARGFKEYWDRLDKAGDGYPPALLGGNDTPDDTTVAVPASDRVTVRAWCVAVHDQVDLEDARARIDAAQQGALFLMFRPGNTKTLVDDLRKLHERGLFLRGVCNTGFLGTETQATIQFFNKSASAHHENPELILPTRLREQVADLTPEVGVQGVLIHSKTIVLDPFGDKPVIMTGSHNLGPKASGKNDDNLVIIEGAHGLAAEFAVYIMNVYDQYKWRYEKGLRAKAASEETDFASTPTRKAWSGLRTTDAWQNLSYLRASAIEARFWFGE